MTDTPKMPERIYAAKSTNPNKTKAGYWSKSLTPITAWGKPSNRKCFERQEYIRSDIHEALTRKVERLEELLQIMYDGYEGGTACFECDFETGGEQGAYLGNAFKLETAIEDEIIKLLNARQALADSEETR